MGDGQLALYNGKQGGEGHSDGEVEEPEAPKDQEQEDFHGCRLYTLPDECSSRNSDVDHIPNHTSQFIPKYRSLLPYYPEALIHCVSN